VASKLGTAYLMIDRGHRGKAGADIHSVREYRSTWTQFEREHRIDAAAARVAGEIYGSAVEVDVVKPGRCLSELSHLAACCWGRMTRFQSTRTSEKAWSCLCTTRKGMGPQL